MASYDAADFARRMREALVLGWFPAPAASGQQETAPALQSLLLGAGGLLAGAWTLIEYVKNQTRISSASDTNLELIAQDFYGLQGLPRQSGESDAGYRARIQAGILPSLGTRAAVLGAIESVIGQAPNWVLEPRNASDTKGRGSLANPSAGGGYGYGSSALRFGSLRLPYQMFVSVNYSLANAETLFLAINRARAVPTIVWVEFS